MQKTDFLKEKIDSAVMGTRAYEFELFNREKNADFLAEGNELDAWNSEFRGLAEIIDNIEESSYKPRVAIAVEDIVGPIRNGGIGTTYFYLAKLLAQTGIDVTILYLRGDYCEKESIDHWVRFYRDMGINFVPVKDYFTSQGISSIAARWVSPAFNLVEYLKSNSFDIVHCSEWRGSGYLALMLKRTQQAFANTEFIVKCSSPWLWNRIYAKTAIRNVDELVKIFLEKRSVELGDRVIGGSKHLLRWMISQGYKVDQSRSFVQPNVILTDTLSKLIDKRKFSPSDRVDIEEIVFFGRLEERKGLIHFCDAIDVLYQNEVYRDRICDLRITFMGKEGARLHSDSELSVSEYIRKRSANWTNQVQMLTEFQQFEAISYLLENRRLAVMPSEIENSSLAVYECLLCGIPFIASNTGGTSELVAEEYHDEVLFDVHPANLALSLENVIINKAIVAEASFSNDVNNQTWRNFHLRHNNLTDNTASREELNTEGLRTLIVIYHKDQGVKLKQTIASIRKQSYTNYKIVVVDDATKDEQSRFILDQYSENDAVEVLIGNYFSAGYAYNIAVSIFGEGSDFIFFTRPGNGFADNDSLGQFVTGIASSDSALLTSFYKISDGLGGFKKRIELFECNDYYFYHSNQGEIDFIVHYEIFRNSGGFNNDLRGDAVSLGFIRFLNLAGYTSLTMPQFLLDIDPENVPRISRTGIDKQRQFKNIRPYLALSRNNFTNMMLFHEGATTLRIVEKVNIGLKQAFKNAVKSRLNNNIRPVLQQHRALSWIDEIIETALKLRHSSRKNSLLRARELFDDEKYGQVIEVLRGMKEVDENKMSTMLLRARTEEKLGDFGEAERWYEIVSERFPNKKGMASQIKRVRKLAAEVQFDNQAQGIIEQIDANYFSGVLANDSALVQELIDLEINLDYLNWPDIHAYAKAGHFLFSESLRKAITSYDPDMIGISVDFGYLVWPRRIQTHIKGKHVLDVGCGFGGYGTAFLATGAASYTGLDPAMDLTSKRAKNKRIREWREMPKTPEEIKNSTDRISLIQGRSEDVSLGDKFDVIVMHNVTEHLLDIDSVFSGFQQIMHDDTTIVYLHHHYYGWNGHHKKPVTLEGFNRDDPEQVLYADWNHVVNVNNFPADAYVNTGLNKITLGQLERVTKKYFNIKIWDENPCKSEIIQRLTESIFDLAKESAPDITKRDLLTHTVFCVATKK